MQKKTIYRFAVLAIAAFAYASLSVPDASLAKNENVPYTLPEIAGVYDVPGKPNLKLKVIVYHVKDVDAEKAVKDGRVTTVVLPEKVCRDASIYDQDSTASVSPAGWKLPLTWTYRVNVSSVPSTIGSSGANTLIDNGYDTWQAVLGTSTTFSRGANTSVTSARADGQNIVTWGRTPSGTLAVTYIWYQEGGYASEIDTIMNNKYRWAWSDPSLWTAGNICAYQGVYDAQGILTHELGHTVGLDDHYTSAYANNTMFGYGNTGDAKESTLTIGDRLGAKAVYGL